MPGPSPLNSACRCCTQPPTPVIGIQFVSASQSCSAPSCGETPCTSTEAAYDEEGNCFSLETTCSPNYADLSRAEKCGAKRYLTVTTEDLSGGGNHGRTQVKQYTVDEDGNCDLETTCSGTHTVTTEEEGEDSYTSEYTYSSDPDEDPISGCQGSGSGTMNSTTVVKTTYNNDCSATTTLESCSGSSNYSSSFDCYFGGPGWSSCTSTLTQVGEMCQWNGWSAGEGDPEGEAIGTSCIFPDTTTVTHDPPFACAVNVTYTGETEQGPCNPEQFPAFPSYAFALSPWAVCSHDEGYVPPDPPELEAGQWYFQYAHKYVNPHNPQIKSEQRVKFRVKHGPSGTCYLKVWFRKLVQKWKYEDCDTGFAGDPTWEGGTPPANVNCDETLLGSPCYSRWSTDGEPTFQDHGTYEWRGSGYPCYEDDDKLPTHCNNVIEGAEKELTAGENESITLEYKFSFAEGYEPNWPDGGGSFTPGVGQFNGSQGCKPNGFPISDPADCPPYNPT